MKKLSDSAPVSRWELIDAISKLHVIQDGSNVRCTGNSSYLPAILNNSDALRGTSPPITGQERGHENTPEP